MFQMEEDFHEPPVPSNGIQEEVVDLTASCWVISRLCCLMVTMQLLQTLLICILHVFDELSEGTLGGWDTSLVQHSVDMKIDKAVSKP